MAPNTVVNLEMRHEQLPDTLSGPCRPACMAKAQCSKRRSKQQYAPPHYTLSLTPPFTFPFFRTVLVRSSWCSAFINLSKGYPHSVTSRITQYPTEKPSSTPVAPRRVLAGHPRRWDGRPGSRRHGHQGPAAATAAAVAVAATAAAHPPFVPHHLAVRRPPVAEERREVKNLKIYVRSRTKTPGL